MLRFFFLIDFTVGAKSISPAISISPSATADVLRGQNTFFPKKIFRLPK